MEKPPPQTCPKPPIFPPGPRNTPPTVLGTGPSPISTGVFFHAPSLPGAPAPGAPRPGPGGRGKSTSFGSPPAGGGLRGKREKGGGPPDLSSNPRPFSPFPPRRAHPPKGGAFDTTWVPTNPPLGPAPEGAQKVERAPGYPLGPPEKRGKKGGNLSK